MIYPSIGKLTEKTDSRYSLVIATAKRAREISKDTTREVKKPVVEAINEINNGEVVIISEPKPDSNEDFTIESVSEEDE